MIFVESVLVGLLFYVLNQMEVKIIEIFANIINVITFISPGQNIMKVCRNKKYKLIPIVTTIFGCVNSFCWLCYGILKHEIHLIIINTINEIFSFIYTFIWIYFYFKAKDKKNEENKEEMVDKEMTETDRGLEINDV